MLWKVDVHLFTSTTVKCYFDEAQNFFTEVCIATEMPSDEPGYRKPSPRFILESLAKHRIPKENAVMVGDNPTDWEAGNRAGIQVVAIESSVSSLVSGNERLGLATTCRRFNNWDEISDFMSEASA